MSMPAGTLQSSAAPTVTPIDPYASYYEGTLLTTATTTTAFMPYSTSCYQQPQFLSQTYQPHAQHVGYQHAGAAIAEQHYTRDDPYYSDTARERETNFRDGYGIVEDIAQSQHYPHNNTHYEAERDVFNGVGGQNVTDYHHRDFDGYRDEGFGRYNDEPRRYHRDESEHGTHRQERSSYDYNERDDYYESNGQRDGRSRSSDSDDKRYRSDSDYEVHRGRTHEHEERFQRDADYESREKKSRNSDYDYNRDHRSGDYQRESYGQDEDQHYDSHTQQRTEVSRNMSNFEYDDDYSSLPLSFGKKRKARQNSKSKKKPRSMQKYHRRKYNLFHRFDEGIQMDEVAWYSVTPESIARHHARRFRNSLPPSSMVLDAFAGGAGNAIQLALANVGVIAIELCAKRLELARHNAGVYGVANDIEFLLGNAYHLLPVLKGVDAVLLSPPWGGPEYKDTETFDVEQFVDLVEKARGLTPNIAILLPKSINFRQALKVFGDCEVEQNWDEDGIMRMVTIYFGCLVRKVTTKKTGPTWVDLSDEGEQEKEDVEGGGDISPVSVQEQNIGSTESLVNATISTERTNVKNGDNAVHQTPTSKEISDQKNDNGSFEHSPKEKSNKCIEYLPVSKKISHKRNKDEVFEDETNPTADEEESTDTAMSQGSKKTKDEGEKASNSGDDEQT